MDACNRLMQKGVVGIITSCGFLSQIQTRLAEKTSIPIAVSSLIQIPFVLATISSDKHIGVLTFEASILGKAHFDGVGIPEEMQKRITVVGSTSEGPLHGIVRDGIPYNLDDLNMELASMTRILLNKDPNLGAIILECTQMPVFARTVQKISHLPVYDILPMADWFYSGLCCKVIPPEDTMEDALRPRKRGAKEGKI